MWCVSQRKRNPVNGVKRILFPKMRSQDCSLDRQVPKESTLAVKCTSVTSEGQIMNAESRTGVCE